RPRLGPTRQRLEHWCLDLDETRVIQVAPYVADRPGPQLEGPAGLGVHQRVQVALAVARLVVDQAAVHARRRPQGLGPQCEARSGDCQFARLGGVQLARHAHPVTDVEALQGVVLVKLRLLERDLDTAGGVLEGGERQLAQHAEQHDPAGHRHGLASHSLAGGKIAVSRMQRARVVGALEGVRVRVYPTLDQRLQVAQALVALVVGFVHAAPSLAGERRRAAQAISLTTYRVVFSLIVTSTWSPTPRPMSALPMGDSS